MKQFPVKDEQFKTSMGWCGNRPQCVAVAKTTHGFAVRSTTDPEKKTLFFNNKEWKAFTNGVKNHEFDV